MACLPNSSKCEWSEIKEFVAHYNKSTDSKYSHKCCLDVEIRDSEQPEVLCVEDDSELVIERKNFMWPINYAQVHNSEHRLFNAISEAVVIDRKEPFELFVPVLTEFDSRIINDEATIIANKITEYSKTLARGQKIRFEHDFGEFRLWHQHPCDRENGDPATGMSYLTNEISIDEIKIPSKIPDLLVENTQKLLESTNRKFNTYSAAHKILIFNFVNSNLTNLDTHWWSSLFSTVGVPSAIDEIWTSFNYEDNYWNFEKIH